MRHEQKRYSPPEVQLPQMRVFVGVSRTYMRDMQHPRHTLEFSGRAHSQKVHSGGGSR